MNVGIPKAVQLIPDEMASPRDLTLSLNLDTTLGAVYIGAYTRFSAGLDD